jgi:hypothetical protein
MAMLMIPSGNKKAPIPLLYYNGRRGAALMEMVVTILIIAILAGVTSGMFMSLMQVFIYLPNEIMARSVAQEAMVGLIEGTANIKGARSAYDITWQATNLVFACHIGYPANNDKRALTLAGPSSPTRCMLRLCSSLGDPVTGPPGGGSGNLEYLPYYANTAGITVGQRPLYPYFRYYDRRGNQLSVPVATLTDITFVEINLVVRTGSGLFQDWQGSYTLTSGVDIKQCTI